VRIVRGRCCILRCGIRYLSHNGSEVEGQRLMCLGDATFGSRPGMESCSPRMAILEPECTAER